jgi:TatD DNase family protein
MPLYTIADGYIDCHCHLADPRIADRWPDFVERAEAKGISHFLMAGIGPEDWQRQGELCKKSRALLPCYGLHPYWIAAHADVECDKALEELQLRLSDSLGLGEIGLDYREKIALPAARPHQLKYFHAQLALAQKEEKAVVLHIVRAHDDAIRALKKYSVRGMVHAFNSNWKHAKAYLDQGLYLSIGAAVLDPRNEPLREAIVKAPLDRLLIESDSPDQPPPELRGQLHEPSTILLVAECLAGLKKLGEGSPKAEDFRASLRHNLLTLFKKELRHEHSRGSI